MVHNANVDRIFSTMQSQCCKKRDSFLRVVQSVSNILKVRDNLGLESLEHLNQADINTKSVIKDRLYDCDKCPFVRHSMKSFKILKMCVTEYNTKIQEALLTKRLNPQLNKKLYAKGASFLLSIFYCYSGTHYCSVLTLNVLVLPFFRFIFLIVSLLTSHRNTPGYCCMAKLLSINPPIDYVPANCSSGNVFVSGAVGLRFKSRAGQIGFSVANGSPSLQYFFGGAMTRRWAPQTRYTPWRNTASIKKDL